MLASWMSLAKEHPDLEGLVVMPAIGFNRSISGSRYIKIRMRRLIAFRARRPENALKQRLRSHQRWLDSQGVSGQRFVLRKHLRTDFSRQRLERIQSKRAFVMFSRFDRASLRAAHLFNADCSTASFRGADLRNSDLREAILYGADFRKADLRGARLDRAWAIGANFGGAKLDGASLRGTVLSHHGLRSQFHIYLATLGIAGLVSFGRRLTTIITRAQLDSAVRDRSTVVPVESRRSRGRMRRMRSNVVLDFALR